MRSRSITTPDLVVLSLLAERPFHGYELNQELEWREVRDWAGISRPQVYYSLSKLAKAQLIQAHPFDAREPAGGPEREVYAITQKGGEALRQALDSPEWAEQRVPPPFLTWMALSTHAAPESIPVQFARRRAFLERELAKERATLEGFEGDSYAVRCARAMVGLTIAQFELELAWLDATQAALGG